MAHKTVEKCPRCGGWIPNNLQPGAYPGALSRWDNETEVCSDCGTQEAMLQFTAPAGKKQSCLDPRTGAFRWVTV